MSNYYPFPTVKILAEECHAVWTGFDEAAEGTRKAEAALLNALSAGASGRLLDSDSSLVLCGSFARHEMTEGSDYDWTLLLDGVVNGDHAVQASTIREALEKAGLIKPGTSGTFGSLVFSHDLVHRIGGKADSNENLTRRMLLLLESRPFEWSSTHSSPQVWDNVVKNILDRYFEQDVHFSAKGEQKVPRFLLNDLTRYWRTICVDYAAKHQEEDGKKWAMRNAKLRLSRKLLFASGLAFCLSCKLDPPEEKQIFFFGPFPEDDPKPFIASAIRFAKTPSLEYLATFVKAFVEDTGKRRRVAQLIFGAYNEWLSLVADGDARERLKSLSHEAAHTDATFQKVRSIGKDFAKGLRLLFFNREQDKDDPIANLSLDYVGF